MNLPVNYETLTWQERREVRNQYVKIQGNLCHYCKSPLDKEPPDRITIIWIDESLFPTNFFKNPVHLHRNHDTGMTIGAVHCKCNATLWQYHGE